MGLRLSFEDLTDKTRAAVRLVVLILLFITDDKWFSATI